MSANRILAPGEDTGPQTPVTATGLSISPARWVTAVIRTTRPRQWPKNLLVFAAPLAAATLGREHQVKAARLLAAAVEIKVRINCPKCGRVQAGR